MGSLRSRAYVLTSVLFLAVLSDVGAQQFDELVAAGRFDEASTLLNGADAAAIAEGVTTIFNAGYATGFQRQDYEYMIRAAVAAKRIPGLPARQREQIEFWHGMSVLQLAMRSAQWGPPESSRASLPTFALARTIDAAETSLPLFQEALPLIDASRSYPAAIGVDAAAIRQAVVAFIQIQESILRTRG